MIIKNFQVEFSGEPLPQSIGFYLSFLVVGLLFSFAAFMPMIALAGFIVGSAIFLTLLGMLYAEAPKTGLATAVVFLLPTICLSAYLFVSKFF